MDEWDQSANTQYKKFTADEIEGIKYPFDLIYGRLVHLVHGSSLDSVIDCPVEDCVALCTTTLPDLAEAVKTLTAKIKDIEQIVEEIKKLEEKTQEFVEAFRVLDTALAAQTTIEEQLGKVGIRFGDNRQFFDRFRLENFLNWDGQETANVQGTMPDYRSVVENMEKGYLPAITALTIEEAGVLERNKRFLERVEALAWSAVDRRGEITTVEKPTSFVT